MTPKQVFFFEFCDICDISAFSYLLAMSQKCFIYLVLYFLYCLRKCYESLFQKTNFMMLQVTDYMIIAEMLQLSIADKNILKTVYSVENDDRPIRTNTVFD